MIDNVGLVIRQGPAATLFALQFMATAKPFSIPAAGGTGVPVMLYPGQRMQDGSVVIGKLDGIHIYLAKGDKIYEGLASNFASRALLLNDVSGRIQRSMWLAAVGEAELEFIFVVCATLVGTLGTAIAVGEFVCDKIDLYYEHKREIDLVRTHLEQIHGVILYFRQICPVLFNFLVLAFLGAAGNALDRAWQGVTMKDVAYFAGKFAAYAIKTKGNFVHALKEAVIWTAALRTVGIALRSMSAEIDMTAGRLRALGQTAIGRDQLAAVLNDTCVRKPEVQAKLQKLTTHLNVVLQNLQPFLEFASPSI